MGWAVWLLVSFLTERLRHHLNKEKNQGRDAHLVKRGSGQHWAKLYTHQKVAMSMHFGGKKP